jgi:hypothetical protein
MQKWKPALLAVLSAGTLVFGASTANADPSKSDNGTAGPAARVPSEQQARMRAQDKARSAASQIRWAVERSTRHGFTGIELHQGAVRLYYQGALPNAVRSAVGQARGTAPVEVLPAKYSLDELQAASDRMVQHLRAQPGGPAHRVSIPVDGSGLVVGVDPTAVASASSSLPDVGVPVQIAAQQAVRQSGRGNDFAPFYGGASIYSDDHKRCTAAFGVKSGAQEYLLTAGHCGWPGQAWRNGDRTQWIGYVTHDNIGQDIMMIATNAGSHVFTGVGPTSTAAAHVYAWDWVYTGEELCSSGAVTTWLCGHVVMDAGNSSYCGYDAFGNWECYGGLVWSRQEDGALAGRPGDSGGPVVLPTASGLIAKGVISGAGGADLMWQDFATAWQLWGVSPVT